MSKGLPLKESVIELQKQWFAAKDAEKQWAEYRRAIEAHILSHYSSEAEQFMKELNASDSLSTGVKLDRLKITFKRKIVVDQEETAAFCAANPQIATALFKTEFKLANSKAALTYLSGQVRPANIDKALVIQEDKPYFSAG